MDSHTEQELVSAIYSGDSDKFDALLQGAAVINHSLLLRIIMATPTIHFFDAALKHSSVDPFANDNSLLHAIISYNLPTEYLAAVLDHSNNHLSPDQYHALLSEASDSKEKQDLLESHLNKQ